MRLIFALLRNNTRQQLAFIFTLQFALCSHASIGGRASFLEEFHLSRSFHLQFLVFVQMLVFAFFSD